MARTVSIGAQSFADIREGGYFYIDKTGFVRDWWSYGDQVTLVCRPRRFGKTLAPSCSSDDSVSRLVGFARNDARIRVLRQEHGGLSTARDNGVRAALGICERKDLA